MLVININNILNKICKDLDYITFYNYNQKDYYTRKNILKS